MGKRRHADEPVSKDKKHKKEKKEKRKKSKKSRDSSEERVPDYVADLQNVRIAAEYIRCVLRKWPKLKQDLRDLFWKVDSGEAVDISALPDKQLRGALRATFDYLNLAQNKQGAFSLRQGQDKILRRIGTVLMENIPDKSDEPLRLPGDPVPEAQPLPPASSLPQSPEHHRVSMPDSNEKMNPQGESQAACASPVRRVLGPAMPSQVVLDAGADMAKEMEQEGLLGTQQSDDEAPDVGPEMPMELVAEIQGVSQEPRVKEVLRIAKLLDVAARTGGGGKKRDADAYAVLDVDPEAQGPAIKKKYWRLSLLIHPDKCAHPMAADSFHAVKLAAETLQDDSLRAQLDKQRDEDENVKIASEIARDAERQRQWRIQMGTATQEDFIVPEDPNAPVVRDEWMTVLPEVIAKKPALMEQKSVKTFSQSGVMPLKQESAWATGPAGSNQKCLTGGAGPQQIGYVSLVTPEMSILEKNQYLKRLAAQEVARTSAAGDTQPVARKSLVQEHQEKLEMEAKEARKRRRKEQAKLKGQQDGTAGENAAGGYQGDLPWRPFDRDMDLKFPDQMTGFDKVQAGTYDLSSRFTKGSA